MPPRRSARAAAAAATSASQPASQSASPLEDCVVAISGAFPNLTQAQTKDKITSLGGTVSPSVNNKTTHLVTTEHDFLANTTKVKAATEKNILIVRYDWLLDCETKGKRLSEKQYDVSAKATAAQATVQAQQSQAASKSKGAKRAASVASDDEADKGKQPAKKRKATNGKANGKTNGTKQESGDESEPTKGKAAKGKKAVKKEAKDEPKVDGQVAKSKDVHVPLDEGCLLSGYSVYIDSDGHIWDASLNQTNASNNNNKFYRLQVIRNAQGDFQTWTRWGRVGERGATATLGSGTKESAISQFEKKFKDKSGLDWSNRMAPPKPKKYTFIERSYNQDSDEEEEETAEEEQKDDKWVPPECKLEEPVQDLMKLIFNQQYFDAAMSELNYDSNKLPLGKLSKQTITRGFQALKDLSALLDDSSIAATKYPDMSVQEAIEHLSNTYYSVIPHAFGRNSPPVIQEKSLLKKEVELLESLSDMKDASNIMGKDKVGDPVHPLTKMYNGLNLSEMTALEKDSSEFRLLKTYLNESRGETHGHNYTVREIFRIERQGEKERFEKESPVSDSGDRRLLWHGSRVTNYGGILSQGLRIAPPEAPVSGYMFGKGIYLADMSSKSANYCCSYISGNEALLLLCEAQLGDPVQELTDSDYDAGENAAKKGMYSTWGRGMTGPSKWKDAGAVHDSLKGVKMPDTSVKPGDTGYPNAWLQYNEYIVYDLAQVRLRYLLRVKM
ncbi:uncharacterized protein PgNI_02811 [Pyricularia grisea]|uniref:Poly [ADP-ribose] polymerase n=1 Tax=Pyricularia grisea TaxID=148305 RepID=A0A6P8BEP3_PYRGI|nr:uncharacterized protein PgNI_02811 [Pyricularia grisea]TLD14255.1 hypothetical protein PgNI_02811 [Pyricularia grisea]